MVQWSMVFFFHVSMFQCILYKQHEIESNPWINRNKHQMNMNQNMFSVSQNILAIIFHQVNAIPPFIIFDPRRLTSWCCQLFSSGQRTYETISCVRGFEGVLKCRFEVSSFGGWYFVLCQELEHLNVTWVSERDVPETVEMWNCKTWILCICRGLFYFVQHYQFKVICECISTLKLHAGWSWMHKALAV